jgi:hypothetical protein
MKEIVNLARHINFKAKTLSTQWTFNAYLGKKDKFLVNDECELHLLSEIQKFIRDNFNIVLIVYPKIQYPDNIITNEYYFEIYKDGKLLEQYDGVYWGYEESLKQGLINALKLIKYE